MLAELHDLDPTPTTDRGPRDAASATTRLCIATRSVRPVGELIRFVAGPDGLVSRPQTPPPRPRGLGDRPAGRHRGRGQAARFPEKLARRGEGPGGASRCRRRPPRARGARCALDCPQGRARGPGIRQGRGGDRGRGRWWRWCRRAMPARMVAASSRRRWRGGRKRTARQKLVASFTTAQLDLALGRLNVVHAALLAGRASETFLARWRILERFRAVEPDDGKSGVAPAAGRSRTRIVMTEKKNPGETLDGHPDQDLDAQAQASSRGWCAKASATAAPRQVVVEKVKRRTVGPGDAKAARLRPRPAVSAAARAPRPMPGAAAGASGPVRQPRPCAASRRASCCGR